MGTENYSLSSTAVYKHFLKVREEVLKHKWFESEKAGRDVGFEYALIDWIVHHKTKWDTEVKVLS
jgi:hypothetical protein